MSIDTKMAVYEALDAVRDGALQVASTARMPNGKPKEILAPIVESFFFKALLDLENAVLTLTQEQK